MTSSRRQAGALCGDSSAGRPLWGHILRGDKTGGRVACDFELLGSRATWRAPEGGGSLREASPCVPEGL